MDLPDIKFKTYDLKFEKILGKGSYGLSVLYVDDENIKYTLKYFFPKEDIKKNFNIEYENLLEIKRILNGCVPNIICFLDIFEIDIDDDIYDYIYKPLSKLARTSRTIPIYCIISEYVHGYDLENGNYSYKNYIFSFPINMKIKNVFLFMKEFILSMIETLEMLHSHKIIHNDIKSENIIYDPQKNIFVLIDFGLSCIGKCEKFSGTLGFVPARLYELYKINQLNLSDLFYKDFYGLIVILYLFLNKRYPIIQKNVRDGVSYDENSESGSIIFDTFLDNYFTNYCNYLKYPDIRDFMNDFNIKETIHYFENVSNDDILNTTY